MTWLETRSSLRIATAKNIQSGRSRTLHAIHASECAFWEDPEPLMVGLRQSLPSQAWDYHYRRIDGQWRWQLVPSNMARRSCRQKRIPTLIFPLVETPRISSFPVLSLNWQETDEDERLLLRLGALPEAIEWRRWAIPNLSQNSLEQFQQEYPSTPREAFLTTGRNVFPIKALEECYKPRTEVEAILENSKPDNFDSQKTPVEILPSSNGPVVISRGDNTLSLVIPHEQLWAIMPVVKLLIDLTSSKSLSGTVKLILSPSPE